MMVKSKKKFKRRKSGFNVNSVLLIIIIVIILGLGFVMWNPLNLDFSGIPGLNKITNIFNQFDSSKFNMNPSSDCTISFDKNKVCVGDSVTGTLKDGANAKCIIAYNYNSGGWKFASSVTTDSSGSYTDTQSPATAGTYLFAGVCDKGNGNFCRTNDAEVVVEACDGDCTDSDGNDRDTPGHVTIMSMSYYDKCLDVGSAVTEYTCVDGTLHSENLACDYGEVCVDTRSGGYCTTIDDSGEVGHEYPPTHEGGTMTGDAGGSFYIDMNGIEVVPGGNCRLGAKIDTTWSMEGSCNVEIGGFSQGLEWVFSDSDSIEWSYADAYPQSRHEDLCPVEYDGITPWKMGVYPMYNLENCVITYEFQVIPYICECD